MIIFNISALTKDVLVKFMSLLQLCRGSTMKKMGHGCQNGDSCLLFSKLSFGVYFIHPIILDILKVGSLGRIIIPLRESTMWATPLSAIFVYFTSCLIIFLMQKNPLLKKIAM